MNEFIKLHDHIDNSDFYLNASHIVSFELSYDKKYTIIHISIQDDAPYYTCKENPEEIIRLINDLYHGN